MRFPTIYEKIRYFFSSSFNVVRFSALPNSYRSKSGSQQQADLPHADLERLGNYKPDTTPEPPVYPLTPSVIDTIPPATPPLRLPLLYLPWQKKNPSYGAMKAHGNCTIR